MNRHKTAQMDTIKEITKRRLQRNPGIKKPFIEQYPPRGAYIEPPPLKPSTRFKVKDKDVPEIGPNPYIVPQKHKTFGHPAVKRKNKPIDLNIDEPRTVTDHIHDQFYKVVEGRPVRPITDIKVHMTNIRNIFFFRANAAYLKDQILNIDTLMKFDELGTYNKIEKLYQTTLTSYQYFLKRSLKKAQDAIKLADNVTDKVNLMHNKLEEQCFYYNKVKNEVIFISDKLDLLIKYRDFIIMMSPLWWRLKNLMGFTGRSVQFKRFFIETDSEEFNKCILLLQGMTNPLYFNKPEELLNVLDDISNQCANYMIQSGHYSNLILKPVLKMKTMLKTRVKKDTDELKYFIDVREKEIKFYEEKEREYINQFFKILNGQFKEQVASYDYLKLHMCVQDICTHVLGNIRDSNDSLSHLMRQVEVKYDELLLGLDYLDLSVVKATTEEYLRKDRENMRKAYLAQRELKSWGLFDKKLRACFDPPKYKNKKKV